MSDSFWERLIVAAVGPLLTAGLAVVLVNQLSRRWQNRQKVLEIRTELVSDVSEAIMEVVMAVQFAHMGAGSQEDLDDAYRKWEIRSAVIGTRLQAYFGLTALPEDWTRFSSVLTLFYALEGVSADRKESEQEHAQRKLNALLPSEDRVESTWSGIRRGLLLQKSAMILKILTTPMPVLGPA